MRLGKLLVGLASGAAFGMLFAPKKGKKLREEIVNKSKKGGAQDSAQVLLEAFKEAGAEALEESKRLAQSESVQSAVKDSHEKMKAYFSQIEQTGYDIAARAKEKLEELQDEAGDLSADFKKRAVKATKAAKKKVKKKAKAVKKTVKKAKKEVKKTTKKATKTVKKTVKAAKKQVKKTVKAAKKKVVR